MRAGHGRRWKREWWIAFALFSLLGALWALATPLYAAPDEPAQVIRAASVARGEVLGDEEPGLAPYYRVVTVPKHFVKLGTSIFYRERTLYVPCFAFLPETTASCFGALPTQSGSVRAPTSVGLDPPAFYLAVGLPSLFKSTAGGIYLMRFMSALLCGALLASALLSLRSIVPAWLAATGLGFALTPMTVFLSGTVNPSGVEICAAIGVWASGAVLVHEATKRVDRTLVRRTAIAMLVLVLARGLSPLWLAIMIATGLALGTRGGFRKLAGSAVVRRWSAAVVGISALSVVWLLTVRPLDSLYRHGPDPGAASVWTLFRRSFGDSYQQYRMMVGVFGWLDTSSPSLSYVLWGMGVAFLVVAAIALSSRRHAAIVVALTALSVVVPVFIDVSQARKIGLGWQGRWTLPLAVGVPIVAALGLAWSSRRAVLERAWLPVMLAAVFVVAQFLAFAQALRRYTVAREAPWTSGSIRTGPRPCHRGSYSAQRSSRSRQSASRSGAPRRACVPVTARSSRVAVGRRHRSDRSHDVHSGHDDPPVRHGQPEALPESVRDAKRARNEGDGGKRRDRHRHARPADGSRVDELSRCEQRERGDRRVTQACEHRVHGVAGPSAEWRRRDTEGTSARGRGCEPGRPGERLAERPGERKHAESEDQETCRHHHACRRTHACEIADRIADGGVAIGDGAGHDPGADEADRPDDTTSRQQLPLRHEQGRFTRRL